MSQDPTLDASSIKHRLTSQSGREYWRSLDELADTPEFREFLHREFPREASVWEGSLSRRSFLQIMGASLALGGLSACMKQPDQKIIPYVRQPEIIVPGNPLQFATAAVLGGFATGVLATSHMGRPTRIDGNPGHPASVGATDVFTTASLLSLYDPDRSKVVLNRGEISTWEKFQSGLAPQLEVQRALQGSGLRILSETVTSPTLGSQLSSLLTAFPKAQWLQFEPVNLDAVRQGATLAFGEYVHTRYHFDRADVILSLDADFLYTGAGHIRYARDFAERRRVHQDKKDMNRLYVVEASPTVTGGNADERLAVRASQVEQIARMVAQAVGGSTPDSSGDQSIDRWVAAAVRDLQRHQGSCVVVPGLHASSMVHALAHGINHTLGNIGKTVTYTTPVEYSPVEQASSLKTLAADIDAGDVDMLIILGGNPAYTAPEDLHFSELLARVGFAVHFSMYNDETSRQCEWHIPESHYLETWSDARAFDGTTTILQPLIAPLYDSKSAHDVVEMLMGGKLRDHDIVRNYWRQKQTAGDFETFWKSSLNNGVIEGTALSEKAMPPPKPLAEFLRSPSPAVAETLEMVVRPDPSIWDGRFSNNGWLQELPKPLSKLTWDNAVLVGPGAARRLGVSHEEVAELSYNGRTVKAPVLVLPGHPDGSVTVHLGYGRADGGKVETGAGFNAYVFRTLAAPWGGGGLEIRPTGEKHALAITQDHHSLEGRDIILAATLADYNKKPNLAEGFGEPPRPDQTLYPEYPYDGYAWGMSIDLNACIGCNACVTACQSENNIPIVGKEQVLLGREMHWIRVDRYYRGDPDDPEILHQPLACVHCENAPCEVVCPVGATVHDSEGLNVMTYNRCIGTRYCSNNCPYKVRRFNFLEYSEDFSDTQKMMKNPDVTVRSRGVMEKCTYCVQRISAARIIAKEEGRDIRDGDVVTACQAACPSSAIIFGNINDPDSLVVRRKAEGRSYGLLAGLNTKPRTTYLAKLTNPNPDIDNAG